MTKANTAEQNLTPTLSDSVRSERTAKARRDEELAIRRAADAAAAEMDISTRIGVLEAELAVARQEAVAATEASAAAANAITEAAALVPLAEQELADAKAELEAAFTDGVIGDSDVQRLEAARSRLARAESDLEWAQLRLRGTEVASGKVLDAESRARVKVQQCEYRLAQAQYNDPKHRIAVLMRQLSKTLSELLPLLASRQALHVHLAQQYSTWSTEDRAALNLQRSDRSILESAREARTQYFREDMSWLPSIVGWTIIRAAGRRS